jgi:hypothetical protein
MREASAQTGFRQQSADAFWFSVPASERFIRADVRWPDGRTQMLGAVPRNQRLRLTETNREGSH